MANVWDEYGMAVPMRYSTESVRSEYGYTGMCNMQFECFRSREHALAAELRDNNAGTETFGVMFCPWCKRWHVAYAPQVG